MNNEYSSAAKKVNNDKKIQYSVLLGGVEIGRRTTGRIYSVAVLAKHSRAYGIEAGNKDIAYYKGPGPSGGHSHSPEKLAEIIKSCEDKIAKLQANAPDSFYDDIFVASWHSSRISARVPKWLTLVGFVPLVQPVA